MHLVFSFLNLVEIGYSLSHYRVYMWLLFIGGANIKQSESPRRGIQLKYHGSSPAGDLSASGTQDEFRIRKHGRNSCLFSSSFI